MTSPAVPTWLLTFYLLGASYEGGQYQSEYRCQQGAKTQLEFYRKLGGSPRIKWRCELHMP